MWRLSLFSSSFVRAGLCKFITWWIASGEWNHGLQRFPSNLWGSVSLINGCGTRPFKAHQSYILQCKWGRYSMTMKSGRHKRFSRKYHQFLVLTNRFTFFCIQNFFDANMVSTLERIYLTLPKILYYSYHGKLLTLKTPNGIHFRRLTNINRMHTKLSWMPFFSFSLANRFTVMTCRRRRQRRRRPSRRRRRPVRRRRVGATPSPRWRKKPRATTESLAMTHLLDLRPSPPPSLLFLSYSVTVLISDCVFFSFRVRLRVHRSVCQLLYE